MRRWVKRGLILLAIFVLVPAAFYFYADWRGKQQLRAVLAELDANETPWRWEDLLAARPELQPQEDAKAVILSACRLAPGFFGKFTFFEKALAGPPNRVILPEDFAEYHELMKSAEPAVIEARKLNQMPGARFQTAWGDDIFDFNFNEIQKAREFIRPLHCFSAWRAHQGDLDAAIEDCQVMQRACQSLGGEPSLIVHLVRIAMQSITMNALERVLAQGQPSPQSLEKLQQAWERFDQQRAMLNCLRGERAYSHRWYETLAAGKVSIHAAIGAPKGIPIPFSERVHGIYMMANLNQSHAWTLRHWNDVLKTMELTEPERTMRQTELDRVPASAPTIARMMTPAIQKVLEAHRRAETATRCAITALAAERFRRDHARWPKSLDELCPKHLAKVLDDPYTGNQLQLRTTGDGIVIYSVGADGKQSGNYQEEIAAGRSLISYEFRLWNVSQRRQMIDRKP